jgi:hypothetical protein
MCDDSFLDPQVNINAGILDRIVYTLIKNKDIKLDEERTGPLRIEDIKWETSPSKFAACLEYVRHQNDLGSTPWFQERICYFLTKLLDEKYRASWIETEHQCYTNVSDIYLSVPVHGRILKIEKPKCATFFFPELEEMLGSPLVEPKSGKLFPSCTTCQSDTYEYQEGNWENVRLLCISTKFEHNPIDQYAIQFMSKMSQIDSNLESLNKGFPFINSPMTCRAFQYKENY